MALDPERLNQIVQPHRTVSDRIRALDRAGVPRADIARFLGKRYQHVRNVLEGDAQQGGGYVPGRADLSGVAEASIPFERPDDDRDLIEGRGNGAYRLVVQPDGSIMLPKEVSTAFDVTPGQAIMARFNGEEFILISGETAMDRVRAIVRRYVPADVSLVDSLIADRIAEAAREEAGD